MSDKWSCKKCGACCRVAGLVKPELDSGSGGKCKYLNVNNLCMIYDQRPEYCRVPDDGRDQERKMMCKVLQEFE